MRRFSGSPGLLKRRATGGTGVPAALRPLSAFLLLAAAWPAAAQDAPAAARPLSVVTSLGTSLSYSDISGAGGVHEGGQFVARVSPGIQMNSRSGRIVGSLNYTLNANFYSPSQTIDADKLEHSLSAAATAEAVPGWLYVDGRASVTRQAISVFGLQSVDGSAVANDNRTDVLNLLLSPYVKGLLGDVAEYELRLIAGATNGNNSKILDSTTQGATLGLKSRRTARARFGWSLQASQQTTDYRAGRATDSARIIAGLSFSPDVDWVFALRGGAEETDVGGLQTFRYDNWGFGARWTPSTRTTVSVDADRRYFGNGHQIALEHRFRRAAVRYTSARDASNGADATGTGQPLTLYQLYFLQFASVQPDPDLRQTLVLNLLKALGQDPNAVVGGGGFSAGAVTVQRRDDLSLIISGLRTTLTLQATHSSSRVLDNPTGQATVGEVRQFGLNATASHRLTPRMTVTLLGSVLDTRASDGNPPNRLKSVSLGLNTAINPRTTASLTARYSLFDGTVDTSYRESALSASLNLRF